MVMVMLPSPFSAGKRPDGRGPLVNDKIERTAGE
jgi:hypothetical protein